MDMAYAGKLALVKVASTPINFTDEAMTTSDNLTFQITNTSKRIWDYETDVIVKVDVVEVTTGFKISKLDGKIIFDNVETGTVTVTGKYVPTTTVAEAHEYSIALNADTLEVTRFQDEYKRKIPGLLDGSGSISDWDVIDTYFVDNLISGKPVVIELYPQSTLEPTRMFAILESTEMSAAVSGEQDKSVSFSSTEKMIVG